MNNPVPQSGTTMERQHHPFLAAICMLLATVFLCLSDILGKWLSAYYPIVQITWLRGIVGVSVLFVVIALMSNLGQLKTRRPGWHVLRSINSAFLVLCMFYGLKHIPLAEFVSLTFSVPFFVAMLSPWFLKENTSKQVWVATIAGFIGIMLVLRPTADHFHIAHVTTLLLSFFVSLMLMSARYLSTTESRWSLSFYLPVASIFLFGYWALTHWVNPTTQDWLLFVSLGITQTLALGLYIEALRLARAAVVAPMDYIRLIWTIIAGYVIWQEIPDQYTWAGIIIIVASGIYVVSHSSASKTEPL